MKCSNNYNLTVPFLPADYIASVAVKVSGVTNRMNKTDLHHLYPCKNKLKRSCVDWIRDYRKVTIFGCSRVRSIYLALVKALQTPWSKKSIAVPERMKSVPRISLVIHK